MRLHIDDTAHAFPIARRPACPRCGDTLFAASAAAMFLDKGKIKNTWSCETCEHEFCTALALPSEQ